MHASSISEQPLETGVKLILVRHGESEFNAMNRGNTRVFCGQIDSPLTDLGRRQAKDVAQQLASRDDINIGWAISSTLSRASETLKIILGCFPQSIRVLSPNAGLNERSLGEFEGRSEIDVFRENPQYRDDPRLNQFRVDFVQKAPGGENLTDVSIRTWQAIQETMSAASIAPELNPSRTLSSNLPPADVLVVSHSVAIRCLLYQLLGWSQKQAVETHIPNAAPIVVDWKTREIISSGLD